jgi:hypothetical protein
VSGSWAPSVNNKNANFISTHVAPPPANVHPDQPAGSHVISPHRPEIPVACSPKASAENSSAMQTSCPGNVELYVYLIHLVFFPTYIRQSSEKGINIFICFQCNFKHRYQIRTDNQLLLYVQVPTFGV